MWDELALSLQSGNPYLIAMLAIAFIALVIIFERAIMLFYVYNLDFNKFNNQLKKAILAEDFDRARSICQSAGKTSLPKVAYKAIDAKINDEGQVKGVIEEESIDFIPKLEVRLAILPTLATIILLIGILGTIDALWMTFQSIDVLDTEKKQAILARGVRETLHPTAMGLIVSIIILFGYSLNRGIAALLLEKFHLGVSVLNNLLVPQQMMAAPVMGAMQFQAPTPEPAPVVEQDAADNYSAENQVIEEDIQDNAVAEMDDITVEDIKDEEEII